MKQVMSALCEYALKCIEYSVKDRVFAINVKEKERYVINLTEDQLVITKYVNRVPEKEKALSLTFDNNASASEMILEAFKEIKLDEAVEFYGLSDKDTLNKYLYSYIINMISYLKGYRNPEFSVTEAVEPLTKVKDYLSTLNQ